MSSGLLALVLASTIGCGASAQKATGPRLSLVLEGDNGQPIKTAGFRGRVLVVHVFTSWSLPAKDDALHLEMAFKGDDRVVVLGVVLDAEARKVIGAWRRGMAVTYPIALASDPVRAGKSALGATAAVPFTVVFDRDGRQLHRIETPLGDAGIDEIRRRGALEKR